MNLSPVTNKPYINDAIIGNSSMLAALGRTGELYRLWWPHVDYPQHVERMRAGIYLEGESAETLWLDTPLEWQYEQSYVPKTNVLRTVAAAKKLPVRMETTDFVAPDDPLLIRWYKLTNTGQKQLDLRFFLYASLTIGESGLYNTVAYEPKVDGLVYFRHQYAFALASPLGCTQYTCADALKHAAQGYLPGNKIAMTPDGALGWKLSLAPGETVSLPVYLTAGTTIDEAIAGMLSAHSVPADTWLERTIHYWHQYLNSLPALPTANEQIRRIYDRSLLVFKLMADKATGTVIAAPEFDEAFTRCGGYAYCWGRDAAYITTAFDRAGLTDLTRRFYRWTLTAQDADGSFQQRHYHDGRLAPSWGLQIDEGGSILWGMYQHYLMTRDRSFLEEVWTAVEKGAAFLLSYLDQDTGLPLPSRDLWEERNAEHTYSAAAVYAGMNGAASIARELGRDDVAGRWEQAAESLKEAILTQAFNDKNGTFYRGVKLQVDRSTYERALEAGKQVSLETDEKGYVSYFVAHDDIYDISLVGLTVPFGVLDAADPRMAATADAIERTCTSPIVGGIRRYEDDHYIGGNPWILTTLWLAQYRIAQGRYDEAKQYLNWAVSHATSLGLLPEQIDKQTGETAWVVPLTWSHAMFVLTVHMLSDKGQL
jgi:glucoamylase